MCAASGTPRLPSAACRRYRCCSRTDDAPALGGALCWPHHPSSRDPCSLLASWLCAAGRCAALEGACLCKRGRARVNVGVSHACGLGSAVCGALRMRPDKPSRCFSRPSTAPMRLAVLLHVPWSCWSSPEGPAQAQTWEKGSPEARLGPAGA